MIAYLLLIATIIATANATGRFRVAHAVAHAGAPTVDVYTGTTLLVEGLKYKDTSFYLTVPAGTYPVSVKATGTQNEIFSGSVTIANNVDYTVIAHGDGSANPLALLTLTDNNGLPAAGNFHLRVVHASAGSPNVDVYADGGILLSNVAYGQASAYTPIPKGTYEIKVNVYNTTTTVIGPLDIAFGDVTVYTVIASGIVSDTTVPLTITLNQDTTGLKSQVRVVHAVAEGSPKVDIYVYGALAASNVDYKTASGYLEVPAEKTYLEVKLAGTQTVAIGPTTVTLEPMMYYSVIAHGNTETGLALLPLMDDNTIPAAGVSHVRFVHASAGSPAVDVIASGKVLFENVAYGSTGNPTYAPIEADKEYKVSVEAGGDRVVGPYLITGAEKTVYTIYALGIVGDETTPLDALMVEDAPEPKTLQLESSGAFAIPSALVVAATTLLCFLMM